MDQFSVLGLQPEHLQAHRRAQGLKGEMLQDGLACPLTVLWNDQNRQVRSFVIFPTSSSFHSAHPPAMSWCGRARPAESHWCTNGCRDVPVGVCAGQTAPGCLYETPSPGAEPTRGQTGCELASGPALTVRTWCQRDPSAEQGSPLSQRVPQADVWICVDSLTAKNQSPAFSCCSSAQENVEAWRCVRFGKTSATLVVLFRVESRIRKGTPS